MKVIKRSGHVEDVKFDKVTNRITKLTMRIMKGPIHKNAVVDLKGGRYKTKSP